MGWATGKTGRYAHTNVSSRHPRLLARYQRSVANNGNRIPGGSMRHKLSSAPRRWWQNNPELSLAMGWAVICGGLWLVVRVLGVA